VTRGRRGLRCLLLVLPCALAAGCRQGDDVPQRLVNGAPARASPVPLAGVDRTTVLSEVRVVAAGRVGRGSAVERCLRAAGEDPAGNVVVRTGVNGASVTFRVASGRALYACDGSTGARGHGGRWCGRAFGRLVRGKLRDPRLDLAGCTASAGDTIAFAWIEPGRRARYLALRQPGYVEVYPVTQRLPVRIATVTGIDIGASRASFEVTEHDGGGARLREYELDARVAD